MNYLQSQALNFKVYFFGFSNFPINNHFNNWVNHKTLQVFSNTGISFQIWHEHRYTENVVIYTKLGKIWSKKFFQSCWTLKYWSHKKGESKIGRCPWNNSDTHSPSSLLGKVFLEVDTKLKPSLDKAPQASKWIEEKPCRHSLGMFSEIKCLHWLSDSLKYCFEILYSFVNTKAFCWKVQIKVYCILLFKSQLGLVCYIDFCWFWDVSIDVHLFG